MKNFNLKILGSKEYIDSSKKKIKKLHDEGSSSEEIVEELFGNFPKDVKEVLLKDLNNYL